MAVTMPWWRGRMVSFDLETTSPDPFRARIVSAAVAAVGGGEDTDSRTWLVDPGVEIPDEAAAVHGITTEMARENGMDARTAIEEIVAALVELLAPGGPIVIFNARYDLTVLAAECRRHAIELPASLLGVRVVDPLVFEKWLDRFRKTSGSGSRKLKGMCEHYAQRWARALGKAVPAVLEGAHDAAFDAIAAARLAWLICSMPAEMAVVRNPRNYGGHYRADLRERAVMVRQWAAVKDDLDALHDFTAAEALRERNRFAEYLRSEKGGFDYEAADRVMAEKGWPFLDLPPLCEVCGGSEVFVDLLAVEQWQREGADPSDEPLPEPCPECRVSGGVS